MALVRNSWMGENHTMNIRLSLQAFQGTLLEYKHDAYMVSAYTAD
ncbi:MAG TPA: hypothetical protein PLX97_03015 [Gemmatales bacterium]|nr:hypothetical protein [Gemmatales bacterium]